MKNSVPRTLQDRIRREGPVPFDEFMEAALYGEGGFFAGAGGAGRAGSDFITSPEVGALFGRLVGRAIDGWWERFGRPDPFLAVEAGAGRGRLAAAVLASTPVCAPALRYLLVERSDALRAEQHRLLALEPAADALGPCFPAEPEEAPESVPGTGPIASALPDLPAGPLTAVVVVNELLDNLPFRLIERRKGGWDEIRIGVDTSSGRQFAEHAVPAEEALVIEADAVTGGADLPIGTRLPVHTAMAEWLRRCGAMLRRGVLMVIDYGAPVAEFPGRDWLRTYRAHSRGGPPWEAPGTQDITADVVTEALHRAARRAGFDIAEDTSQAQWLRSLGVEDLVAGARTDWHGRSSTDLDAIKARSLVQEADALLDPSGLGAHRVTVLVRRT